MGKFSRWIGGLRVGADFFRRRDAVVAGDVRGIVDSLAELAQPGVDVSRIHPNVARFFLDTAALTVDIESRWAFPFSLLWRCGGRSLAQLIGQFVLPLRRGRVFTEIGALDEAKDGRRSPRMIVRRYDDGGVFQVASYSTHERLMSCAFPQPLGHVAGLLRLDVLDGDGAVLDSRGGGGVWLVILGVAVPSPFSERFSLWPARGAAAESGALIIGRHEQRFFGVCFVTHHYRFTTMEQPHA